MIKSWKPESTICQTMSCLCLEGKKMGRTVIYFNIYVHVYLLQFLELRVSFNYLNQQSGSDFTKENLS